MVSSAQRPDPADRTRPEWSFEVTPVRPQVAGPPDVHVDCEGCTARPLACGDCVVTYLLGSPPEGVDLDQDEQDALEVLAASGLVPALRYAREGGSAG